jgi:hypothetical protein
MPKAISTLVDSSVSEGRQSSPTFFFFDIGGALGAEHMYPSFAKMQRPYCLLFDILQQA